MEDWSIVLLPDRYIQVSNFHAPFWWCRRQGLIYGVDFSRERQENYVKWSFCDATTATLFALRWVT